MKRLLFAAALAATGALSGRPLDASQVTSTPVTEPRAGVPKGTVARFRIDVKGGGTRKVWVFTPAGYDATSAASHRLLLCFDGDEYLEEIPVPTILDNLLAGGEIRPTVAVMVDSSANRLGDLANSAAFADFLAGELVPWVRRSFHVSADPAHVIVTGSSAGGLAAAFVAFRHPEVFGNVLSESGAFWRGPEGKTDEVEWLTRQYRDAPRKALRFYLEVGATESHATVGGPSILEANRRLRDVLSRKGYPLRYLEAPGGRHHPDTWRACLADGLVFLAGTRGEPVGDASSR